MPHVRSVAVGIWLTRGSRHEPAEASRHRALCRAHALQGHSWTECGRNRAAGRFDRRPDRRVHVEGIRRLLPQGLRRASAARGRHPRRSDLQSALRRRRHRAREEGDPRRDQDGRGHARRSGPRDLRGRVLEQPSARPPDPRHAAKRQRARPEDAEGIFRADLRRGELRGRRRRQSRTLARAGTARTRARKRAARRARRRSNPRPSSRR